jgi:hypothetical protein
VSGEVGLQGPRRPQVDQDPLQRPPGRPGKASSLKDRVSAPDHR